MVHCEILSYITDQNISSANMTPNELEVAVLLSDKRGLKTRNVIKDNKSHFPVVKWFVHKNDIESIALRTDTQRNCKTTM